MSSYLLLMMVATAISKSLAVSITFIIDEEKPINTEVGNVAEKSRLSENRTSAEFNTLRYNLLSNNPDHQSFFRLDEISGILYIDKVINRDAMCSVTCDLEFQVLVQPQVIDIIDLTVTIKDINDNSPVFPRRSLKIEIPENSIANYAYDIPILAKDEDTTVTNSIVKYDYSPKSSLFSVNYTKLLSGDFKVKLVVKQPLDREAQAFYQIYLIAIDGGEQSRSDQMQLNISVTDTNDNAPEFKPTLYKVTVKEDAKPNTGIINVTATDEDVGENGRISYKLVTTNMEDPTIQELFSIDPNTGEIIILKSLTYTGEIYSIIVEATDHGKSPKTAQAGVEVTVEDSGNNPPVIKINVISSTGGVVSISENINIGGFVAHVSVEDSDMGENGRVTCFLEDINSHFEVVKITKGYKVVVKTKLDREKVDLHNVTVVCHDFGVPVQMSSSESFKVKVFDENDNDPVFRKNVYEAGVKENNTIGMLVVQVSATDADLGSNALIQYFLHSDAGSNFAINSNTGVVTASAVYDRENIPNSRLTFHVLAVDRGDPARTGTTAVVLNIIDENDNSPKFNRSIFSFQVQENQPSDTVVGQLQAFDLDKGENSRLSFEIAKEDELNVPFVVYQDGQIRTNQKLDRESKGQHNFIVYVFDHGRPSLNNSAYVTVFVTDSNDNSPVIIFPNKKNSTVWATSSATLPIATIQAYDIDEGNNKKLSYYIHSGNSENMFYLDQDLGELFVNTNYAFTKDVSASLVICVKDAGNPVRSSCAQLNTIVILTNATALTETEPSNNYIMISIVVIVVTFLVSVAIILTIFFLKKIDRNRLKQKYAANGPLGVPTTYSSSSPASSQHDVSSDSEYMERKKKEVTFSPSTTFKETNEKNGISYEVATDSKVGIYPNDTAQSNKSDQHYMQLKAVELQNQYLSFKHPEPHSSLPRGHPGDNHSDTSQETTTSDSGRGNSEDDVPSSAMTTEDRSFDHSSYMGSIQRPIVPPRKDRLPSVHNQLRASYPKSSTPTQQPPGWMGYNNGDTRHYKNSVPHPQDLVHRSTPVSQYSNNTDNFVTNKSQTYVDNKLNSLNLSTWKYLQQQQLPSNNVMKYSNIDKDRDYFHLRPGSLSTLRSREDDDDAATTTSGSYTVNPDELDEDVNRIIKKDYVV